MPDKVVDASAIAAMLFGEPEGKVIAGLLTNNRLLAPELLKYEIGNICWKKIKRAPEQREALEMAFELFSRMRIDYRPVDVTATLKMAETTGLTFYDAANLWLATSFKATLITLDQALWAQGCSMIDVAPSQKFEK